MKYFFRYILALLLIASIIQPAFALTPNLDIEAESYAVIEVSTGQLLIEKNSDLSKEPASITKILTCALGLLYGNPDADVTMNHDSIYSIPDGTTHIALEEGETCTLKDLLHATMLISANDAANGVAQGVSGNLDDFVALMNTQVAALGLENTHFANPHGLHDNNHYTSACDMAMITRWALSVDGFQELFGTLEYDFPETNRKNRDYAFINQNAMLHDVNTVYYEGIEGGKLGYTDQARHTIVTLAKRGDIELICVAMGCSKQGKFDDSATLLDYCFDRYSTLTLNAGNIKSFSIPLTNGSRRAGTVEIDSQEDIVLVVPKGTTTSNLQFSYDIAESYDILDDINPTLTISDSNGNVLTTVSLNASANQTTELPLADAEKPSAALNILPMLIRVFVIVLMVLAGLTILLFIVRFFVRRHYRKKRRRMKAAHKQQITRSVSTAHPQNHLHSSPSSPHVHSSPAAPRRGTRSSQSKRS